MEAIYIWNLEEIQLKMTKSDLKECWQGPSKSEASVMIRSLLQNLLNY